MTLIQTVRSRCKKPQRVQRQFWLIRIWLKLLDNRNGYREPVIRQHRDRQGREWWLAYDPVCNRTLYSSSEAEARLWLDQLRPF
ncbi:hypothetical protein [Myxacorys almedinensis]|uniref:Uncharacterized protein n=1 Tax=Myxacorys almedinensis A TaxID=2690445 RepID=A0A8J7Z3T8_9CYAN|nr:hypothetical protein [Myxacorys almedinensis]NDJ19462.1 hypothetical protein [Myxacorys almedinensis A]